VVAALQHQPDGLGHTACRELARLISRYERECGSSLATRKAQSLIELNLPAKEPEPVPPEEED
jgi:hypothetical protein